MERPNDKPGDSTSQLLFNITCKYLLKSPDNEFSSLDEVRVAIFQRNKGGYYGSAHDLLVNAIAYFDQSLMGHDDRCQHLIILLENTLRVVDVVRERKDMLVCWKDKHKTLSEKCNKVQYKNKHQETQLVVYEKSAPLSYEAVKGMLTALPLLCENHNRARARHSLGRVRSRAVSNQEDREMQRNRLRREELEELEFILEDAGSRRRRELFFYAMERRLPYEINSEFAKGFFIAIESHLKTFGHYGKYCVICVSRSRLPHQSPRQQNRPRCSIL